MVYSVLTNSELLIPLAKCAAGLERAKDSKCLVIENHGDNASIKVL